MGEATPEAVVWAMVAKRIKQSLFMRHAVFRQGMARIRDAIGPIAMRAVCIPNP